MTIEAVVPSPTRSGASRRTEPGRVGSARYIAAAAAISPNGMERVAIAAAQWTGSTPALVWAVVLVAVWAASGMLFRYSDRWQLVINTVTNVATFVMVFVLQRAQTRDALALQLKLNELIAAHRRAHNSLIGIEHLSERQLHVLHEHFLRFAVRSSDIAPAPAPSTAIHGSEALHM